MNNKKEKIDTVILGQGKNAKEADLFSYTDANGRYAQEAKGEDFDGHRTLWSFSFEPYTYLKESGLSGDQWRKGGTIKYFRDGVQIYEQFCRETERAAIRILATLSKLMEFNWDRLKEGRKVYCLGVPAKIGHIILEQGAFMVIVDGVDRFPKMSFQIEDEEDYVNPKELKMDIFSSDIWWYRDKV